MNDEIDKRISKGYEIGDKLFDEKEIKMDNRNDDVELVARIKKDNEMLMKSNNVTTLVPNKSNEDLAQEFREKIREVYTPLLAILDEYDKHGLFMQAGVGKNAFGKFQITQLDILKKY